MAVVRIAVQAAVCTCPDLESYEVMLSRAQAMPSASNVVGDEQNLTVTLDFTIESEL